MPKLHRLLLRQCVPAKSQTACCRCKIDCLCTLVPRRQPRLRSRAGQHHSRQTLPAAPQGHWQPPAWPAACGAACGPAVRHAAVVAPAPASFGEPSAPSSARSALPGATAAPLTRYLRVATPLVRWRRRAPAGWAPNSATMSSSQKSRPRPRPRRHHTSTEYYSTRSTESQNPTRDP